MGKITEISATIENVRYARVVIPNISTFNSLIWLVQKLDGAWRKIVNLCKLSQVVMPITTKAPSCGIFTVAIQHSPWHLAFSF